MTGPPSRAPTYLQPRPKSLATSNTSSEAATASKSPLQRPAALATRQSSRLPSSDPLSDKATTFLIRRTLCSQLGLGDKGRSTPAPIEDLLPPLTSSNDVDLQLYAFIAIVMREFVYTWYAKITLDQSFVEEVVQIIAHCTRALEQRIRKVDLESVIFDELPDLLDAHVRAYRAAHYPLHPEPLETDPRGIYHSLWPCRALSPVPDGDPYAVLQQTENETAYRQLLVQGVLAVLLPTEDLENDCLTSLVGQIFSEMILGGGIGGKACEPWLLWEGIMKAADVIQSQFPKSKILDRFDKSALIETGSEKVGTTGGAKRTGFFRTVQETFWLILQYSLLILSALRFMIITIASTSSLPSRLANSVRSSEKSPVRNNSQAPTLSSQTRTSPVKQPILSMRIWSCASNLLNLDTRMPWLGSTISLLQWAALRGPGKVGGTDGMIDKLLSHAISTRVLDPTIIPSLLRNVRAALFPNNALAPPRATPSSAEQILIRERCAATILSLIPVTVQDVYFGPGLERRVREVEEVLDVLSDTYCNKHLMYGLVELLIVRLMPELTEKGVEELLEERLS